MILQRNLSLLANRLHKERGGRRIPEAVLERDYCLAWFLVGLGQSLIFKGGTALKRCHFGDYRFSEDLDFTLARPAEFAEVREGLEEVFERVAQASGTPFRLRARRPPESCQQPHFLSKLPGAPSESKHRQSGHHHL